jgi:hypothetical protein
MKLFRRLSWLPIVFVCAPLVHGALIQGQAGSNNEQITGLPKGVVSIVAVVGAVLCMVGGLWLVFDRLKQKQQGFGPNSLKALGLVLFVPTLVIVGV